MMHVAPWKVRLVYKIRIKNTHDRVRHSHSSPYLPEIVRPINRINYVQTAGRVYEGKILCQGSYNLLQRAIQVIHVRDDQQFWLKLRDGSEKRSLMTEWLYVILLAVAHKASI